jgi:hypothetical protein
MAEDFDSQLRKDLEADLEALIGQLREAMKGETTTKITEPCEKCSCAHFRYVKTPDFKQKLAIAEFLTNRGYGRPGQADSEADGEKITFIRQIVYSGTEPE